MEAVLATFWFLVSCLAPLVFLGGIVVVAVNWARKGPPALSIDLRRSYFYLIAFITLLALLVGLTQVVGNLAALALDAPLPSYEYSGDRQLTDQEVARRNLALAVAGVAVSAPVWFFHWGRSRAAVNGDGSNLSRVYIYGVLALFLLGGLVFAGMFVFQILRLPLGLVDLAAPLEARGLVRDIASAGLSALIAILFWLYHWRVLESTPPPSLEIA